MGIKKKKNVLPRKTAKDLPVQRTGFESGLSLITDHGELLKLEKNTSEHIFGLACDVGTTTVCASICNLENFQELSWVFTENLQAEYGVDIKSRREFAQVSPQNRKLLRDSLIASINKASEECVQKSGVDRERIFSAVIAGNIFAEELLFGKEFSLGQKHKDAEPGLFRIKAKDLNLGLNPQANVRFLRSFNGQIGADIISGIIGCGLSNKSGCNVAIDLGTNFKVIVSAGKNIFVSFAAECFLFEGFNISCGMVAKPGAIEWVKIENGRAKFLSIGHIRPQGICGSGIIDLAAELIRDGILEENGTLNGAPFVVYEDGKGKIEFTQADAAKFIKHRSAIFSATRALIDDLKIPDKKIENIFICGALGNALDAEQITAAGIVPKEFKDKIIYCGNASFSGVKLLLLSAKHAAKLDSLRKKLKYVPICESGSFQRLQETSSGKS